jgi:hypothetical protein
MKLQSVTLLWALAVHVAYCDTTWVATSVPRNHGEVTISAVEVWATNPTTIQFEAGPVAWAAFDCSGAVWNNECWTCGLFFAGPQIVLPMIRSDSVTIRDTAQCRSAISSDTMWSLASHVPQTLEAIGRPRNYYGTIPDTSLSFLCVYNASSVCPFSTLRYVIDDANKVLYVRCSNGTNVKLQVYNFVMQPTEKCGPSLSTYTVRWQCDSLGDGQFLETVAAGGRVSLGSRWSVRRTEGPVSTFDLRGRLVRASGLIGSHGITVLAPVQGSRAGRLSLAQN